jgi:hypothetical protein
MRGPWEERTAGEPRPQATPPRIKRSPHRRRATRGGPEVFSGLCAGGAGDTIPCEIPLRCIVHCRNAAYSGPVGCGRWSTTDCERKGRLSGLRPQQYRNRPQWEVVCLSAFGREAPATGGPSCSRSRPPAERLEASSAGCSIRNAQGRASRWTRRMHPVPIP